MRQQNTRTSLGRALRRAAALLMAAGAAWLALMGAGGASPAVRALGESPAFVSAVLRMELGDAAGGDSPIDGWGRIVAEESPLLLAAVQAPPSTPAPDQDGGGDPLPAGQPAPDHDDIAEPAAPSASPGSVVARTLVPTSPQGYDCAGGLYLYNRTGLAVDLAALAAAPVPISLGAEAPQILIMHTHGSEAYTPEGADAYVPSGDARTLDEAFNVVRIGDEIERVFTELGLSVVHDRTLYDYPRYSGAYDRSCEGVQAWLEQYPSIQVVLDVHRDALIGSDGTVYKPVTEVDGEPAAQVMFVIGTDDQGKEHPYWRGNLALAMRIQQRMNEQWPTLARPIALRSGRFNQQLTRGSLLVEVGSHGSTLQEALRGARCFARAAGEVLLDLT